jgi:hypothetical protein
MDEEITPDVTPKEEPAPTVPEPEKPKAPVLDSRRPLKGQVDRLLNSLPKEEDKPVEGKETPPKEDEVPAEDEVPEEVELEEIPEETKLEPLPDWQKYILDNLPNIQVIGHQGEEGKDKVFNVKRLEDLPDDFEFSTKRAELAFNAALASQEVNARDLLAKYRGEEAQRAHADFEALEAVDIQSDVKSLQKAGVLPKFKYEVNDPRFNDDPAVEESNKIYDFYKKINDDYFAKYNGSGRMYRVSYEDAAYRYYALHPKEATPEIKEAIKKEEAKPKTPAQEQREKVAKQVGAPQGAPTEGRAKPLRHGTSLQGVYQLYKQGRI